METKNPTPVSFFQSLIESTTAKMLMLGFLTLMLLIPLEFVKSLICERAQRQREVTSEINNKWGSEVYIYGPILKVPYTVFEESLSINPNTNQTLRQQKAITKYAYFFPENLQLKSNVDTKLLKRNNYESVVFSSVIHFKGFYTHPDFSRENIASENIQWNKACILIRTTNLKSIKEEVKIYLNQKALTFEPVYSQSAKDSTQALQTNSFDLDKTANTGFDFKISYNGSQQIKMVPIGKTTLLSMRSNAQSPSFIGSFLPDDKTKKIDKNGFSATWKILHINRAFPQQSFDILPDLKSYSFGVDFVIPVNEYLQNERAAKYGFLVIGLSFLVFFLIQSISKIKIHIFQYAMIGLALIIFYTLLISITEHSSFALAYLTAATAVISLISLYSLSILGDKKFAGFIALALTGLYTFIYIIIQLENYALLVGSVGCFGILAAVMYYSRKIDWNK